ncbi:MAG: hypothetical protein JNK28_06465 [Burkholderiaceae bacterium]|nr:hypothetical protein [Burkholderiaceae bacterium]
MVFAFLPRRRPAARDQVALGILDQGDLDKKRPNPDDRIRPHHSCRKFFSQNPQQFMPARFHGGCAGGGQLGKVPGDIGQKAPAGGP